MKILCVCGLGIGSSVFLRVSVGHVLDDLGLKDYSLEVADIGSAQLANFDMAVTSVELAENLGSKLPEDQKWRIVPIFNFIDKDELRTKCKETLEKLGAI